MSGHSYTANAISRPARRSITGPPRAGGALGIAGLCVVAMAMVWILAELIPGGQLRDATALRDFTLLNGPHVDTLASALIGLLKPVLFTIWGLALVCVALARGRPRVAVAIAVVLGLAPLSADLLKPLLAHPHLSVGLVEVGPASWPSGHSTAALVLALCAVLVAPRRLRPAVAALGAAFALGVGCALVIEAWHMPSDVLGGYLMATLWMALAIAALRASERRWPSTRFGSQAAREPSP